MQKIKFITLSLLACCLASPLRADDSDPARGRLPDGRAFRTDAQGNQLVDYIAELELSVEQLTRRVQGLEFEAEEKQNQINRLTKAGAQGRDLEERDLLGAKTAQNTSADRFAMQDRSATSQQPVDCSAQISPVQQLLEKARFDLEVARRVQDKSRAEYEDNVEKLRAEYGKQACPNLDCSAEVSKASALGVRYRQELEQTQAASSAEREAQQKRIQDYEATVVRLKADLTSRDEQVRELQTKLTIASTKEAKSGTLVAVAQQQQLAVAPLDRVASLREVQAEKTADTQSEAAVLASNATIPASRVIRPQLFNPQNQSDERASFSAAKTRAVDSLRGSMTGDIHRLRDLIATRDNLFQSYNQSGRALSFKPSPLVSSRGYTLSWVTERVKNAANIYELSSLSRDIREIRTRVQDDIDLVNRMKRKA